MEIEEPGLNEQIQEYVRRHVALAELPAAAIVAETIEYLHGETDPADVEARAWPVVTEELSAHLAAQARWPEVTDSDRLTAAFRTLSAAGLVAREDFACCQNCGVAEIGDEVPRGRTARGYAFYHRQDAERGVDGSGVYLTYGLFGQPATVDVGEEIAAALRAEGLTVHWDGHTGTRIRVALTWQRRRAGRLAALPATVDDDVDIEVELLNEWTGSDAPTEGLTSAARLAGLDLPWLPAGVRIQVAHEGTTVVVRREGDTLVGAYPEQGGRELTVGRHDGMDLIRRLTGGSVPAATQPAPPNFLEATYQYRGSVQKGVPLDAAETRLLLHAMRPLSFDFLTAFGRSGGCVQVAWEPDGLWLEELDSARSTSTGRIATIGEAERMLTVLATEDRVPIDELGGDLVTKRW
ncbi:DUF6891 domain-containing protein [Micromonospora parathelypteridis]|uniref:DUF6891 domain-containing protein n=1 Tax=Micromonospora parathelypteridis TaxID=1839617 RepID=A0A840VQG4_9ACTN|nr:hypothetical protein [Micromonospora parathelypteridis]MBB5479383.1 hypothetical protein [Micromonospora parathelypteridis]GGO01570.1 hypothetical protein GCM10011576_00150 [Micromonospora parathelypteridis]